MSTFFTSLSLVLAAFTAQSALACPGSAMKIHDLTLNSDGVITRAVTVRKESDAQNRGTHERERYVSMVRDFIKLERGDQLTLNAGLQMVDASVFVKVKLKSQDRDAKGIFSSTYEIVQTDISSFSGLDYVTRTAFLAKVVGNYAGNGRQSRGCGEVIRTELDLAQTDL